MATSRAFESNLRLEFDGKAADAKSILSVLTLGAPQGSELTLHAEGQDASEAESALQQLFRDRFGEAE